MNEEKLWTLKEVIENTRKGLIELSSEDEEFKVEKLDLSYITQELIDDYRKNAVSKDDALVEKEYAKALEEVESEQNVACYWGNNWVHISKKVWNYTNNHSGTGCDPVTTSCLCGSGQRWKVSVSKLSSRYCANGAKKPMMAWR